MLPSSSSAPWRGSYKTTPPKGVIVGRVTRRRFGLNNALRWAFYVTTDINCPDWLNNTFAADLGRDGVALQLAQQGLTLRADNAVVCRVPKGAPKRAMAA